MDNAIHTNYLECREVFDEHPSPMTRAMLLGAAAVLYGAGSEEFEKVKLHANRELPSEPQQYARATWWERLRGQDGR